MKEKYNEIERIPEIIIKEINGTISETEIKILHEWLSKSESNKALYAELRKKKNLIQAEKEYAKINSKAAWGKILFKIDSNHKKESVRYYLSKTVKYAAVFILLLSGITYFIFQKGLNVHSNNTFEELEKQISELQESSLIKANGEIVDLQATSKESIVEIDGTLIAKNDSTLKYNKEEKKKEKKIQYNSLVTPKSKVFSVVLSDGSKVWLNSASAIKYPVNFTSDVRKVYLTGEAYFEVKHDTTRPFIVATGKMEVEVLGTHFNVMAYSNEKEVRTTLVSGKVKVKTAKSNLTLKPGMQAQFNKENELLQQSPADTELITSWVLGKYIFRHENMESVMSKISRWYDVDVSFVNQAKKNLHFSGTLHKYNDINETLHVIELATNVKFENSGGNISVK